MSRYDDVTPYGRCPVCGEPGKDRERRPNGNDTCPNGHSYPSSTAKQSPFPPAYHTVRCTYFKPDTGKYYSSGEMQMALPTGQMSDAWDAVRLSNTHGGLPGLDKLSKGWIVLVDVPTHPHDHPKLILP